MNQISSSTKLWMPLWIADYLGDTGRLTTEQHGAYLLLIFDYWRSGPLPDDDVVLAQVCRLSVDAWSINRVSLRAFFFKHDDGSLHHKRIDAELMKAQLNRSKSTTKAKNAAEVRWAKHASSDAPSIAPAMLEQCPSPSPSERTKTNKDKGTSRTDVREPALETPSKAKSSGVAHLVPSQESIDRVYKAYPLKKAPGPARIAIGKALSRLKARGEPDPEAFVLARLAAWNAVRAREKATGKFVPDLAYPEKWFNAERYDDGDLQPVKNCALPSGEMVTEEEFRIRQPGWAVLRGGEAA